MHKLEENYMTYDSISDKKEVKKKKILKMNIVTCIAPINIAVVKYCMYFFLFFLLVIIYKYYLLYRSTG